MEDSMISLPRAQVQSLVGELRPHEPFGMAKKNIDTVFRVHILFTVTTKY